MLASRRGRRGEAIQCVSAGRADQAGQVPGHRVRAVAVGAGGRGAAGLSRRRPRRRFTIRKGTSMTTEGIEAVYLTTRNWGKAARFMQALGYEPDFTTAHNSGLFRNGDGPYIFVAEVPHE